MGRDLYILRLTPFRLPHFDRMGPNAGAVLLGASSVRHLSELQ